LANTTQDACVASPAKVDVQRLDQCARARDLRALLGEPPGEREPCVRFRHFEPAPALVVRMANDLHPPA
jgi:hypothetical protein